MLDAVPSFNAKTNRKTKLKPDSCVKFKAQGPNEALADILSGPRDGM